MLVLLRKKGQCIVMGDPDSDDCIVVLISRVRGDQVSVAIEAPQEVVVDRGEVTQRKGKQAASEKIKRLLEKYHPKES